MDGSLRNTLQPRRIIAVQKVPVPQVFRRKGEIEQEHRGDPDQLHVHNIDGPGREQVQQAGGRRLGIDHQVVAADLCIDVINDPRVNVHPDEHPQHGFPGRAEAFHHGHVDGGGDDQSM